MLECNGLSVKRGGKCLLRDVSFLCERGEVTVLFGKNGAGKSSLLAALTGALPYGGSAAVHGAEILRLPPLERAKRIALLPQFLPQTDMTVGELCAMGRYPHRPLSPRLSPEDLGAMARALSRTGMEGFSERRVSSLSGGERQRAFLAMLLSSEGDVLLFDEPTAALDPAAGREILALLSALAEEGKCVLAVMHDLEGGIAIAHRALLLDGGTLAFAGTKEELLATDRLETTFGVRRYTAEGRIFFA